MTNDPGSKFRETIQRAEHESVTADLLGEESGGLMNPRLHNGALYTHLEEDEQPHFIFRGRNQTPHIYGSYPQDELSRSRRYKTFHVVTDERWLSVVGNKNGDQTLSIPLENIQQFNYEKDEGITPDVRFSTWEIAMETNRGFIEIPILDDFEERAFVKLGQYLALNSNATVGNIPVDSDAAGYTVDGVETYQPDQKTIANLLDKIPIAAQEEANELVSEAEDAEQLVRDLNALLDEYDNSQDSINDIVANAEDADELREHVATTSDKVRNHAERGVEEIQTTLREADPEEVANFAAHSTNAAMPYANYAARGNLVLVGALIAGGAIGARVSSDQDSVFDDIDPRELSATASAMATTGGEIFADEHQGGAVEAVLGISTNIATSMTPEEYAQWVTQADPEAVMEGAQKAAALQDEYQNPRWQTQVLGGGLGLLSGYSDVDNLSDMPALGTSTPDSE